MAKKSDEPTPEHPIVLPGTDVDSDPVMMKLTEVEELLATEDNTIKNRLTEAAVNLTKSIRRNDLEDRIPQVKPPEGEPK